MQAELNLNYKTIGQDGSLLDHHYSLFYGIQGMVGILEVMTSVDAYIVADAAVLVHDGIPDITAMADADGRQSVLTGHFDLFDRLIIVYAHQVTADDGRTRTDTGTDT